MKTYLATIHVVLQVEDDQCPEDYISELLHVDGKTILDWCYDRTDGERPRPRQIELPADFAEHDLALMMWPEQLEEWRRSLP